MSQSDDILRHMKRHGPITPMDALQQYGCFRLAARIADLRGRGYPIVVETVRAGGKRFARYRMPR